MNHGKDTPAPDKNSIVEQLDRILSSPDFRATKRQREFLRFVVQKKYEGRVDQIKAYAIATSVLGRGEDFDQKKDAIVSAEASRLRMALEYYYLASGRCDPILIEIPKGTYAPVFLSQTATTPSEHSPITAASNHDDGNWPTILVKPLKYWSEADVPTFFSEAFSTDLAINLTRYQDLRVLTQPPNDTRSSSQQSTIRFLLDGNIQQHADELKISISLLDQKTGRQVWGDQLICDLNITSLFAFQEQAAQVIAAKIAEEQGVIARTLSIESRQTPPKELKTYEAIGKYYRHDVTFTADSFIEAVSALEQAVISEPVCPQAWACLGRLYMESYGLETGESDSSLEKAAECLERGIRLDPSNQRARIWLAYVRMMDGQLSEGLIEAQNALALNPNSLLLKDVIGYTFALLGKWDFGIDMLQKAISLNPYHRPYVHHAVCIDQLRQEKYEEAYWSTLNFRLPNLVWDPILQASTLGHLGREKEADRFIQDILAIKPDFPARGKRLIGRFLKFEDLVESIVEGLELTGLKLD